MNKILSSFREPVSGLTHLFGAFTATIGLFLLASNSLTKANPTTQFVASVLYGISLITMYITSSSYHLIKAKPETIKLLRKFDHIAIFTLIAGSYTPFCLVTVKGNLGYGMCIAVWTIAILGTFLKIYWLHAPRWFYVSLYVAMGWLGLLMIGPISETLDPVGVDWLVSGGILYTVGAIIYGTKKPDPFPNVFGFHEIWHLFVMAASFCHFWCVYRYV